MKALILNSGTGSRIYEETKNKPKCLIEIKEGLTILDLQIQSLIDAGINEFVITTGFYDSMIKSHISSKGYGAQFEFAINDLYDKTNYIYSVHLAKSALDDDIILMHGDLVFEAGLLEALINCGDNNCVMITNDTPEGYKDFRAGIEGGEITIISTKYESGIPLMPSYKISKDKMRLWLNEIENFVSDGNVNVYAEDAFNKISRGMSLKPFYIDGRFCMEIDTAEDLAVCRSYFENIQ